MAEFRRIRLLFVATIIAVIIGLATSAEEAPRNYAKGQVWKYHTRPQDPSSLIKIGEIEQGVGAIPAPIYHISVTGVHLGNADTLTSIGHLPVSGATLDGSVTELTNSDAAFPDVSNGIAQWRAAHGGVFTISLAEIVNIIDQTMLKNKIQGKGQ